MALLEGRFFTGDMSDKRFEGDGMAEYFGRILSSGVWSLGTNLQVAAAGGMNVSINYGSALVDGYLVKIRDSGTGTLPLVVEAANSQPRIDRVIIRKDSASQGLFILIKKGTPATTPVAPSLTRTDTIYEISLAKIAVAAAATNIVSGNITDDRSDANACGIVRGVVDVDTLDGNHASAFATSAQGTLAANALPASSYTAADILAKIKTVDGTGSGLDADLLDGKHSYDLAQTASWGSADLNSCVNSGMYRVDSGNANKPAGCDYGQLIVSRNADTVLQIISDYNSKNLYWRSGNPATAGGGGVFSPWRLIAHDGNRGAYSARLSGPASFTSAPDYLRVDAIYVQAGCLHYGGNSDFYSDVACVVEISVQINVNHSATADNFHFRLWRSTQNTEVGRMFSSVSQVSAGGTNGGRALVAIEAGQKYWVTICCNGGSGTHTPDYAYSTNIINVVVVA